MEARDQLKRERRGKLLDLSASTCPIRRPGRLSNALFSYIPEGSQARIHFWSVQRDPRNFSYPESFYPDRWLIAEELLPASEKFVHNPNAYVPFSFGPANCVGKNLALQEMRILVCHMMQKLNMRFEEGWDPLEWERNLEDRMVYKTGCLPVIMERRS